MKKGEKLSDYVIDTPTHWQIRCGCGGTRGVRTITDQDGYQFVSYLGRTFKLCQRHKNALEMKRIAVQARIDEFRRS
jgi:hypothetical protein